MTKAGSKPPRAPAKKITREVLKENPLLAALARARAKEIKQLRAERRAGELPLDDKN